MCGQSSGGSQRIAVQTGSARDNGRLRIKLSGFQEVIPPNLGLGAIFSTGSGRLTLKVARQNRTIVYDLTYSFPDAAATPIVGAQFVNQAHLHFGQAAAGWANLFLLLEAFLPGSFAAGSGFRLDTSDARIAAMHYVSLGSLTSIGSGAVVPVRPPRPY